MQYLTALKFDFTPAGLLFVRLFAMLFRKFQGVMPKLKVLLFTLLVISNGLLQAKTQPLCVKGHVFHAELADTPVLRSRGLMERPELDDRQAMLFIHDSPRSVTFWMKNMRMAIDIIYLDQSLNVLQLFKAVPPCEQTPCPLYNSDAGNVMYVLEIKAGHSDLIKLNRGDRIFMGGSQETKCSLR